MLPTQKEAWGKSVSPDVNIQKTPQRTLSAEIGSQSTTDSESSSIFVHYDGHSVGAAGSPAA